jgi:hypothetical protein
MDYTVVDVKKLRKQAQCLLIARSISRGEDWGMLSNGLRLEVVTRLRK